MSGLRAHDGGRACRKTPEDFVVNGLEIAFVSSLLLDPGRFPSALELVAPPDFADGKLATVLSAMVELHERGEAIDVTTLADELDRQGKLAQAGGAVFLAQLADHESTSLYAGAYAARIRRHALEREERELHRRVAEGEQDPRTRARIAELGAALDALEDGGAARTDFADLGFTGDALRSLREREEPVSPLPGFLDPEPHLHVLQGKPKSAKTTLACAIARAWSSGEEPWPGAPKLPGSRGLIVSREQTVRRIDYTLRRLSTFGRGNGAAAWPWTDRLTIVGRDSKLPRAGRRLLTLDEDGRRLLRSGLLAAQREGDPFGLVVLDSLSRLKPPEVEEIDNDGMAAWLDALEEIAVETGAYVLLIHHQGHSGDPARSEARNAGRGASCISAVASVLWLLERVPENPRQRVLKVDGNAILPAEFTFEVANEKAEPGCVDYFRPVDPLASFNIDEILPIGDAINLTKVAWRIAGRQPSKSGERPPGAASRTAKDLASTWRRSGLVETYEEGNAVILRRIGEGQA